MSTENQELYDPMVYDIMRERANRLIGRYLHLARIANDPETRRQWSEAVTGILDRIDAVDPHDEEAVRAASADFSRRFNEIERLRVAAG